MPKAILDDGALWLHIGALIAIAIGLIDVWHFGALQHDLDIGLVLSGLAGMGLKLAYNAGKAQAGAP